MWTELGKFCLEQYREEPEWVILMSIAVRKLKTTVDILALESDKLEAQGII